VLDKELCKLTFELPADARDFLGTLVNVKSPSGIRTSVEIVGTQNTPFIWFCPTEAGCWSISYHFNSGQGHRNTCSGTLQLGAKDLIVSTRLERVELGIESDPYAVASLNESYVIKGEGSNQLKWAGNIHKVTLNVDMEDQSGSEYEVTDEEAREFRSAVGVDGDTQ